MTDAQRLWAGVLRDWAKNLKSENRSDNTIRLYTHAGAQLRDFLAEQGALVTPEQVDRTALVAFMAHMSATAHRPRRT